MHSSSPLRPPPPLPTESPGGSTNEVVSLKLRSIRSNGVSDARRSVSAQRTAQNAAAATGEAWGYWSEGKFFYVDEQGNSYLN